MITYIFGAGASKAENLPVTSELIPRAIATLSKEKNVNNVIKFLKEVFYIDFRRKNISYPSIENMLNIIDACIIEQRDISKYYDYNRLEHLRDDFTDCMAQVISKASVNTTNKLHDLFIENLFLNSNRNNFNTSFINLNYDVLLDSALIKLYNNHINGIDYDIDYCINFRNYQNIEDLEPNYENRAIDEWHMPRKDKSIYLLKPHGSLQWQYCPNCQSIKITPKVEGDIKILPKFGSCEYDGSLQRRVIIAPTWHKNYSNPNITSVWLKCGEVLRKSKELFFIGYSLPEADHRLRYLFKKNTYRGEKRDLPLVTVITRKDSTNIEILEKRYKTLFGNKVEIKDIGFETYAQNPY